MTTPLRPPSLFTGIPLVALAEALGRLERRRVPAGSVLIAEGDLPGELYIVRSGTAAVVVADSQGGEVQVARIGRRATLGDMSLLTGQPAAATVRAVTDVDVTVVPREILAVLAERFPEGFRNLAELMAWRVAAGNRLVAGSRAGQVIILEATSADDAVALADSVAWHSRRPTLLLSTTPPPPGARRERADLEVVPSDEPRGALLRRVEERLASYSFLLVHVSDEEPFRFDPSRVIRGDSGRPLDAVARELAGLRVGVVLGGGSIRGYAHLGALDVFERAGIPIDFLAGCSVGAVVSGLYALGNDTTECAHLLDLLGEAMVRAGIPHHGILSTRALRKLMRTRIPHERIEDLAVPLGIVTADIETQEEVVLRRGNLGLAMLAATALPGIYPAVRIDGHSLVDGGVINPVPVSVVAGMGADVVIAVRLGSLVPQSVDATAEERPGVVPSTLVVIRRAIDLMQTRIAVDAGAVPTVTITPEFAEIPGGKLRNFSLGRRYIEAGEAAAEAALPRIAALLPWLRK